MRVCKRRCVPYIVVKLYILYYYYYISFYIGTHIDSTRCFFSLPMPVWGRQATTFQFIVLNLILKFHLQMYRQQHQHRNGSQMFRINRRRLWHFFNQSAMRWWKSEREKTQQFAVISTQTTQRHMPFVTFMNKLIILTHLAAASKALLLHSSVIEGEIESMTCVTCTFCVYLRKKK